MSQHREDPNMMVLHQNQVCLNRGDWRINTRKFYRLAPCTALATLETTPHARIVGECDLYSTAPSKCCACSLASTAEHTCAPHLHLNIRTARALPISVHMHSPTRGQATTLLVCLHVVNESSSRIKLGERPLSLLSVHLCGFNEETHKQQLLS